MAAQSTIPVPGAVLDDTLKFVELASFVTKRACDEVAVHRGLQKTAAELRGPLLEQMIRQGMVAAESKQGADAMLASHPDTLRLLKGACDVIADLKGRLSKQATDLGAGDPSAPSDPAPSSTGYSNGSPYVGGRTTEKMGSDLELLKIHETPSR